MNDTTGPSSLVPTFLVFGTLPALPVTTISYPVIKERMIALRSARKETDSIVAESCIAEALSSKLLSTAHFQINPGDQVRTSREK